MGRKTQILDVPNLKGKRKGDEEEDTQKEATEIVGRTPYGMRMKQGNPQKRREILRKGESPYK